MEKKDCLEILFQGIKTKRSIELCELEEGLLDDGIILDMTNNHYVSEMIFSFNKDYDGIKDYQFSDLNSIRLQNENRIFAPFEDGWIYVKLYRVGDRENDVIRMLPLLLKEIQNPLFFFIRYTDEKGRHLRIRFKFQNEKDALNKSLIISKWLRKLRKDAYLGEWSFCQYERESNRYGGIDLIQDIEKLFWMDSIYVIELLNLFNM